MLVLTRKQGEQIRIGDDVLITVVRTKGKGVRLGIQAPAHVPVLRGEIARAIVQESERQQAESADGCEADDWSEEDLLSEIGATRRSTAPSDGRVLLRELVKARGA